MESARESHTKQKKWLKLVLFPLPLQGHINPMFQLASILYSEGFSIAIIHTSFNYPDTAKYPHFTFHQIPDGLSEADKGEDVVFLLWRLNTKCVEPLRDCLAKLLLLPAGTGKEEEEDPVACLITDAIWPFSQAVADGLGLPRLVLRTTSICSFVAIAAYPLLKEKGYLPLPDLEQAETPIEELPPLKAKDVPGVKSKFQDILYGLVCDMIAQTKACSGLIWNSLEELEPSQLTKSGEVFQGVPMFPIGPIQKYVASSYSSLLAQDRSCLSWLDAQSPNSVLYVSFGSVALLTRSEFLEIAWGLANSNQPFIWVIRPGLVVGLEGPELLPNGFEEMVCGRGCIVQWAPQQEVLAHPATGGFWTHSGWNSTLESICEGVPMICMPNFGDQLVNARYVSDVWKVGLHLEGELERKKIESAIRRVMEEAEGKQLRERVSNLKKKLDCSLKPGGSSFHYLESLISYISSLKF